MEVSWVVAKENEVVEDADLSEGVGESKESDVRETRIDGGGFQSGGRYIAVDSDEGDEKSILVLRGVCQMTLSKKECMIAALRARKDCLPKAAAME